MVEFGVRLKLLRKQNRLTQKQLASMIGLQHSVISFYEVGDRTPSVDVVIKLAAALHVTTDYLLGVEKRDILDLSSLSSEDKALVHTMVNTLRQKQEYKN